MGQLPKTDGHANFQENLEIVWQWGTGQRNVHGHDEIVCSNCLTKYEKQRGLTQCNVPCKTFLYAERRKHWKIL